MSTIVLVTDSEANFKVPSQEIVNDMIKKGTKQRRKSVGTGDFYCQKDFNALFGKVDGKVFGAALRIRIDPRGKMTIPTTSGRYQMCTVWDLWDLQDLIDWGTKKLNSGDNSKRVRYLKMQMVLEEPHEVIPKQPYRTE